MTKLKRLKIRRYRNVEPCELVFSDRFNILLGPNGAGKTTLLNLISKVLRSSLQDASDPFSIEVELAFEGGTLSGTIESMENPEAPQTEISMQAWGAHAARSVALPTMQMPRFELRVNRTEPPSTIQVRRNRDGFVVDRGTDSQDLLLVQTLEIYSHYGLLAHLLFLATRLPENLRVDIANEIKNSSRLDESIDTFRSITARQEDPAVVNVDLRPRILSGRRSKDGTSPEELGFFSIEGLVTQRIVSLLVSHFSDSATGVSFNHEDLPFLSETVRLLGLRSATAKLELTGKSVQKNPKIDTFEFGNLRFWFTRKDGSIFQDQHLSYGQKRLLAFLYYLDANPSFVIADELVNGLHHAWIQECMDAIGDRQAFLTSQNPLLLDYLWFDSVEQVKETFILCRSEATGDSEQMIWRNLTDDEAEMFYSAYKVGIEHVGEILRTRGLW